MFDFEHIGLILAAARQDLFISRKRLAALADVPAPAIAALERGEPGLMTAEQFSRVLYSVGLSIKVTPIQGPRPTFDDLKRSSAVTKREQLFASWLRHEK